MPASPVHGFSGPTDSLRAGSLVSPERERQPHSEGGTEISQETKGIIRKNKPRCSREDSPSSSSPVPCTCSPLPALPSPLPAPSPAPVPCSPVPAPHTTCSPTACPPMACCPSPVPAPSSPAPVPPPVCLLPPFLHHLPHLCLLPLPCVLLTPTHVSSHIADGVWYPIRPWDRCRGAKPEILYTDMRCLTTRIYSEKCIFR